MKKILTLALSLSVILMACKKDENIPTPHALKKSKVTGVSQKGPFLNGSSLTAFELDESFAQTGKSFNTEILDNLGSFELDNISLITHYAKLKADGFYFNEVTNVTSAAPISLYALSDLSDKNNVNVNLLSTLEVSRVQYLISNGASFTDAKQQAEQEILHIFSISKPGFGTPELLNIASSGDDNAILLAISVIIQGYRSEAELSELIGNISTDIRTDGVLNSPLLGSALINDARLLNLSQIRSNIENRYITMGVTTTIPGFEHYIQQFVDSTAYTFTNNISYPASDVWGTNLLNATDTVFSVGTFYSFSASLPHGTSLKIQYTNLGLAYDISSINGWTDYGAGASGTDPLRTQQSATTGLIRLKMISGPPASAANVKVYFYENGAILPSRIKTIHFY